MKRFLIASLLLLVSLGTYAAESAACAGDCRGDGQVTVDDLVTGVRIGLELAAADQCASIDIDGDLHVTPDEVTGALNAALAACPPPRLVALSRDGKVASLDIANPWAVRASEDLGAPIASARCRGGRCLVVHPSVDSISIVDAAGLAPADPIVLERGADPRDVAFISDDSVLVSQYGRPELLEIDLTTRKTTPIDLSALADDDGLPEPLRLARCGRRVFVQLRRVDHESEVPAAIGAALAVIDLARTGADRVVDVDPDTRGVQGIALARRPNFDMPADCAAGMLYVAEPVPVLQGGGGYETVDLETLTAAELPIATGAEVGGFEVVEPGKYWLITHTDFGPGASSHLNLVGGTSSDTYNTFGMEHVNDLALDRDEDLLFFPDNCTTAPSCDSGIHVFHAHTGERAIEAGIDIGFPPIEVVVSR